MITLRSILEERLCRQPLLVTLLHEGVLNHLALARYLRPSLEEQLGRKLGVEAIAMAIRRLKPEETQEENRIFSDLPEITIRPNLVEITLSNSPASTVLAHKIAKATANSKHYFVSTQGAHETMIIGPMALLPQIENEAQKTQAMIAKKIENLSAVLITLKPATLEVPGVYAHILQSLALAGVNLVEVVSTYLELSLIIDSNDAGLTFAAVNRLFRA